MSDLPPGDAEHASWLLLQISGWQVDQTGCNLSRDCGQLSFLSFGGEIHVVLFWVSR